MLSWDDTERGYAHLSDGELRVRRRLFMVFQLGLMQRSVLVWKWLRGFRPVQGLLDRVGAWLSRRFYGGSSLQACQHVIADLEQHGIASTLDYCAEDAHDVRSYEQVLAAMTTALSLKDCHVPFLVLKISSLVPYHLLEEMQRQGGSPDGGGKHEMLPPVREVWEALQAFCSKVAASSKVLLIDAEESWVQDVIDDWVEQLMMRFNRGPEVKIYHTVQMYRRDRYDYLCGLIAKAEEYSFLLGIKLVRGAYLEKERARALERGYECPLHGSKEETDRAFHRALDRCVQSRERVRLYLASHNEQSIERLLRHTRPCRAGDGGGNGTDHNLGPSETPWFGQLLGMGDHITYLLAQEQCQVTKYIPYGPVHLMIPYLMRRAEENSSIVGHGKREYGLLQREYRRRRKERQCRVSSLEI